MKYLAYGSNLSVEQMARRCPDAKIIGKAILQDWRLKFKSHATIEPCKGTQVPVLVWEISVRDENRLDSYEGFPTYYIKQNMEVEMTSLDGTKAEKVTAMVYVMADGRTGGLPTPRYYNLILKGYKRFGFDEKILREAVYDARMRG